MGWQKQIVLLLFIKSLQSAALICYDIHTERADRVADAVEISADKPTVIP